MVLEGKNEMLRKALISTMLEFRKVKPTIQNVCGIPAGEFFFLQRIHELSKDGDVRVSHLRDAMSMTMQAVSQFVRTLEEKGMVQREIAPNDRRVTLVTVTPKGKQILEDSQQHFNHMLDRLIQQYGPEELEKLIQMLDRLCSTIRGLKEDFEAICSERTDQI